MKLPKIFAGLAGLLTFQSPLAAEFELTTWSTGLSGQYVRIYETKEDALASNSVSTWSTQALPVYSDIQKVEYSDDWVYIYTTGLASHLMGPWYFDYAKTELFNNMPTNQNVLERYPRTPTTAAVKTTNNLGSLGRWINGVGLFNMLDGAFYANGAETQDNGTGVETAYWIRNAMFVEVVTFDNSNGHQPGSGDYHYHADPKALRYQFDDNVTFVAEGADDNAGYYIEDLSNLSHSPILGWGYDGYPIYGPYGYDDPDVSSTDTTIRRIEAGFVPRDGNLGTDNIAVTGRNSLAKWSAAMRGLTTTGTTYDITNANQRGPSVNDTYVIGYWVEDFAFLGDLGYTKGVDFDLDVHNGRFCRTPEYPEGTYAYFVTIDADDEPAFPYVIGRQWYGEVAGGAVTTIDEETTILVEAGPDSAIDIDAFGVDFESDTVTLTWSSVEGGSYTIEATRDLGDWSSIESDIVASDSIASHIADLPGDADKQFYRVSLTSLAEYEGITPGAGGGGPGGGGEVPGTGNPTDGFVFAFNDGPPMENLITNVRVGNVTGTVVAYDIAGPNGGTVTISFDNSSFASDASYVATFTHTPPNAGTTTANSTNFYTEP